MVPGSIPGDRIFAETDVYAEGMELWMDSEGERDTEREREREREIQMGARVGWREEHRQTPRIVSWRSQEEWKPKVKQFTPTNLPTNTQLCAHLH